MMKKVEIIPHGSIETGEPDVKKENGNRDNFFDLVKGVAIFIVVLGHVIQTFSSDFRSNSIELAIVMMHMPLFMMVSGYFFYPSVTRKSTWTFILAKFKRLYLPSLFWGFISCIIVGGGKLLTSKEMDVFYFLDLLFTGAWFLTVLFIFSVIGVLIEKSVMKLKIILWIVVYIATFLIHFDFFMSCEIKFLMPFFIISIYSKRIVDWKNIPLWMFLISVVCFSVCYHIYDFSYSLYMMDCDVYSLVYMVKSIVRFVGGLTGSIVVIFLCKYIIRLRSGARRIIYWGCITLPIYVLHQKFLMPNMLLHYQTENVLIQLLISLVIMILSVGLYKLFSKNPLLRLIMFGEN